MNLLELPDEIILSILKRCSSLDVLAAASTCARLREIADDPNIWKYLWRRELQSSGLTIPCPSARDKEEEMTTEAIKKRIRRLRRISPRVVKCEKCDLFTCKQGYFCREERVVLDIGSKMTWCLSPDSIWQKHSSLLIVDKYGNCLTCEYASELKQTSIVQRASYDRKPHSPHRHGNVMHPRPDNLQINSSIVSQSKSHGVFDDSYEIIKRINPECFLRQPLECLRNDLENDQGCKVLEEFIIHILCEFRIFDNFEKTSASLVFCEPYFMNSKQRKRLCEFLFDISVVGRVCFVNKAYCAAVLNHTDTCLVVDSGCHNTVVSVIIDGQIQPERTQHCPFGGQTLAQNLLDRLRGKMTDCPYSCEGLDNQNLKGLCYLSYDIDQESNASDECGRNVRIFYQEDGVMTEESMILSSELYIASELMYTRMQLPDMVVEAVKGLPGSLVHQLMTRIIVTGGNTELSGFCRRVVSDLRERLPDCANLDVHAQSGSRSWESCMGGTCLHMANTIDPMTLFPVQPYVPDTCQWISREEYIMYGPDLVK